MKREIAAALKAQQAAAAADAANKKKAATTALGVYNDKMLHHQNQWVAQNRGKYTTQAAAQQAWLNAWQNSTEGQNAEKELAPYLADYNAAVKKELRLSAADAELTGGNVKAAVQNTAAGLKSGGNTFQDKVLNDVIDKASGQIANETPEVRHAVLNVYTAIDNYQTALTNQKNLQDSLDKALQGVHNMGLRQEIRDSFTADLNAAQTAVDNSAQALKDAGDLELAVTLSQNVLADVNKLPMGIRRAEPELVSDARQQYQDALNGKFDLKDYSPDQLQAALESVLGNHPEYMTDGYSDFTLHLMEVDNALKMRPTLDMNLDTLSIGKNSPQWMQDLVNKGDKVTAALIVSMGMQNEQPQGGDEKLLAEKDPLAFAILRYSGAHFQMPAATINNVQPSEADIVSAGETAAAKAFQALQTSADKTSQGKAMDLQGLLFASGYVRADYIKQQWQDFAATHSTKQSLDQILDDYLDDKDFNNPKATPTDRVRPELPRERRVPESEETGGSGQKSGSRFQPTRRRRQSRRCPASVQFHRGRRRQPRQEAGNIAGTLVRRSVIISSDSRARRLRVNGARLSAPDAQARCAPRRLRLPDTARELMAFARSEIRLQSARGTHRWV